MPASPAYRVRSNSDLLPAIGHAVWAWAFAESLAVEMFSKIPGGRSADELSGLTSGQIANDFVVALRAAPSFQGRPEILNWAERFKRESLRRNSLLHSRPYTVDNHGSQGLHRYDAKRMLNEPFLTNRFEAEGLALDFDALAAEANELRDRFLPG